MPWDSLTTGTPEGVRLKTRLGLIFTAAVRVLGPPRWCDLGGGQLGTIISMCKMKRNDMKL